MKIHCNKNQALIIEVALDVLSRMTMGQLEESVWGMEIYKKGIFKLDYSQRNKLDKTLKKLKSILFPQLHHNASYGIGQKEIGDAQIAYEMVKKLQNFRTRNLSDNEKGVLGHEPLCYSKEPLIKVEK